MLCTATAGTAAPAGNVQMRQCDKTPGGRDCTQECKHGRGASAAEALTCKAI